ncbi:right-handed parallel beta-helix repeat-containing protein [Allorhodopirellula solitaria]|uniref:Pectate lyase superfamily protein n=1 Tax=Allorhodopirellula solitaria TaxID=2527987 RepID=A0A5C5WXS5_9BACT|nr:right-handed parallel beta-helix repeat-containing protein [Allorhodopirellula solitaria]TWT55370.1 Pectate lyase superfamily protein [Allorhodopirellula solitaria]
MFLRHVVIVILSLLAGVPLHAQEAIDASEYDSLQAAADAIPSAGGVLRIPAGKYEITQPLRIKTGDTRVVGDGTATHLINQNTDGQPAILIENPDFAGKTTPSKDRLWRVSIANLRVTGNDKSGAGIEARYIEEIFVHGVTSSYHGGDGVKLHYCYEDPRISNNLFTYNKQTGLQIEACHDIIVSANQFEENQDGVRCIDSFNLAMSGNNLDDHLGDGVVIENTYGSVVASNMIEECQGWAIVLDRDCYGTTMSANVIAHDFAGGIDLRDAHGCAISANTFTIVKNAAIAVREPSASITISANNFSDTWIGNDPAGKPLQKRDDEPSRTEQNPNEATGVLLQNCEAVVVSGNLFSKLVTESVREEGRCRSILISGNGEVSRDDSK